MPGSSLPCLTLIGSPNFGYRSVHRDLEAQIAIVTESPALQRELHQVGEGAGSEGSFCPWCPAVSHFHDLVWNDESGGVGVQWEGLQADFWPCLRISGSLSLRRAPVMLGRWIPSSDPTLVVSAQPPFRRGVLPARGHCRGIASVAYFPTGAGALVPEIGAGVGCYL